MPKLKGPAAGRGRDDPARASKAPNDIPPARRSRRTRGVTFLGVGVFALLIAWGLWHAVIGPRVIEPMPVDTRRDLPPPDPAREPPR